MRSSYKILIISLILVAAVGYAYAVTRDEFPTVDGFVQLVGAVRDWHTNDGKNEVGGVVYRVVMPELTTDERAPGYVLIPDEYWSEVAGNKVTIRLLPINGSATGNIEEYMASNKPNPDDLIGPYTYGEQPTTLGTYHAYMIRNSDFYLVRHRTFVYLLTETNLVQIGFDYPNGCIEWQSGQMVQKGDDEATILLCKKYFKVYTPIVEKILSSFHLEKYKDNRGLISKPEKDFSHLFTQVKN